MKKINSFLWMFLIFFVFTLCISCEESENIITNLIMGDIDDNQYMIGANFRSSNGISYAVNAY